MSKLTNKFTYGYYIMTALKEADDLKTRENDYIAAGTVNWVSQVSFSPEIISVAIGKKSDLNETIHYSEHFTIHLLSKDHKEYVKKFGAKSTIEDGKINGVPFKKQNEQVILEDTLGHLTCKVVKSLNMGDHTVYFGEVITEEIHKDKEALCTMELPSEYTKDKADI
ncbi:flavin reductase family protein [Psychroflexus gondwanensis]|uniref:Flavin reductase domain-containing FMN-binding protein n=1 Tax=Psychroflexus gondwanensis ACAM 44 TaxID=1189619 RepID=N1WW19_9FLAO|nr:flavin reductase family protein [Psychroflexus gondwanensis]EMY81324.1 flavin reductase domain-containing FMN-binding protein [Psychroflexus gondwanensis ACAM 44]TXE16504.1 flavin reductase family protein [Psychroflexus gondwanensis]